MQTHRLRTTMMVAVLAGMAAAQASSAPCYEPDFGTLLGSADDSVFPAITLGSPFIAYGTVYTQAEVSSNGFVWLGASGNTDSGCCSGTGAALAAGAPRVCALWTDLVTDGVDGSGVYHNPLPGRDVITWVRAFESYDPSIRFTVQIQLVATGFTVWFHPATNVVQLPHTAVCGISPGGVADPGSIDFSASFPYDSGTQPTLYEEWATGTFDLSQRTFEFMPNGQNGWLLLDRPTCSFLAGAWQPYGAGCPAQTGISGASFYELYTGATLDLDNLEFELTPNGGPGYQVQAISGAFFTGYANAVPLQDDNVVDEPLPFPFVNAGGTCTTAGFCSNGFLWLDNFNNAAPAAPYVPAFLFDGPRIAGLWTDLDLTAGGAAYFDATATEAYFTWLNAPDFTNPNLRSTFQIQLFSDGRIRLCYQSVDIGLNRPALAGYGLGGATYDPGPVDLSASVPFASGTGVLPLTLDWTGVPPVLGADFPLMIGNLRPSALAALLALGATQINPGVSLASAGMPGCFLYSSLDVALTLAATSPVTQTNALHIPAAIGLLGLQFYTQAAVLDLGLTPLGLAASNGGAVTVGLY